MSSSSCVGALENINCKLKTAIKCIRSVGTSSCTNHYGHSKYSPFASCWDNMYCEIDCWDFLEKWNNKQANIIVFPIVLSSKHFQQRFFTNFMLQKNQTCSFTSFWHKWSVCFRLASTGLHIQEFWQCNNTEATFR